MKSENIKYKWLFFWYVMVCLSGLYEVQLHFNKRNLFQEYQTIVSEKQTIEMDWRELQLDYSALTSGQKIGLTAKDKVSMKLPDSRKINLLSKDEEN
jgi:cell division protein FtsL